MTSRTGVTARQRCPWCCNSTTVFLRRICPGAASIIQGAIRSCAQLNSSASRRAPAGADEARTCRNASKRIPCRAQTQPRPIYVVDRPTTQLECLVQTDVVAKRWSATLAENAGFTYDRSDRKTANVGICVQLAHRRKGNGGQDFSIRHVRHHLIQAKRHRLCKQKHSVIT